MYRILGYFVFICTFFMLISCQSKTHDCNRPYRVLCNGHWKKNLSPNNLESLVSKPSKQILDFLSEMNRKSNIGGIVTYDAQATKIVKKVLRVFSDKLPRRMKSKILSLVREIYIVKSLGGSLAYTNAIWEGDTFKQGFIVFDSDLLVNNKMPLSYRASRAFKDVPASSFTFNYSHQESIIFLLMHEVSHLFAYEDKRLPNNIYLREWYGLFENMSWSKDADGTFVNKWFTVNTYGKNGKINDPSLFLEKLQKSNMPSIYSFNNVYEDWAESFAILFMKKNYGIEQQLQFRHKGKTVVVKSCLFEDRCRSKKMYVGYFLENIYMPGSVRMISK